MKLTTLLGLIGATIALCLGTSAPAKDEAWLKARTHNFVIYSNGPRDQLASFAVDVERFDALLRRMFNVAPEEHPNPLTIFILSRASDVAKLAGDKTGTLKGFYMPRREGSFAVTSREGAGDPRKISGRTALFHEYTHHFMFRHFASAYPPWYVEGLAEYLSTARFGADGSWSYGHPALHRARDLRASAGMPIRTVLFGDPSEMSAGERRAFYGRAWLLVHMLHADPRHEEELSRFLALIRSGNDSRVAAEAFGDLERLGRELSEYSVSELSVRRGVGTIAYSGEVTITDLGPVASDLAGLSMQRKVGRDPADTRDALARLAAQAPDSAAVLLELALAERDLAASSGKPDFSAAERAVDHALRIEPDLARANVLKAQLMMQRLNAASVHNPAKWENVRTYIAAAIRHVAGDPLPLLAWYESFIYEGKPVPQAAHDALAHAFPMVAEDKTTRVQFAVDLANQGKYEEAIRLVQFLANDPHDAAQGKQLLARLEAMRDKARDP